PTRRASDLVWRNCFELVIAARLRRLVGPPAQERRGMTEAVALQMVVFDLADPLWPQRLPSQVLAGAPAAACARHTAGFRSLAGPVAPGVTLHGIAPQRRQFLQQTAAGGHRERRGDTDVL